MPIRSTRGRAAAYRSFWQWPLRSPARLAITVVALGAVVAAFALGGALVGGGQDPDVAADSDATSAPPTTRLRTATPRAAGSPAGSTAGGALGGTAPSTVVPPVPALEPSSLPLSAAPAVALDVAGRWAASWLRPPDGTTTAQWIEGLRPTTTEEYLGVLSGVDPANVPATQLTGTPRPVRVAPRSVQVEVPTDALTLLVLVVDTDTGWRVSGYDRV